MTPAQTPESVSKPSNSLPPAPASTEPSELARLRAECDRLLRLVKQLEQERDALRRAVHARAWDQVSEEQLQRWGTDEEPGLPLKDFIGELEQTAKER